MSRYRPIIAAGLSLFGSGCATLFALSPSVATVSVSNPVAAAGSDAYVTVVTTSPGQGTRRFAGLPVRFPLQGNRTYRVETVGPGDTVGSAELRSQTSAGMVLDWVLCGVGLAGGIAGGLLFPERRAEIVASSLLVPIGMVLFDGLTGRASAHPSRDVVLHLEPKRYPVSYGLTMVAGLRAAGGKGSFVAYATERRPLSAEQPVVLGDGDLRSRWQWDGRHLTLVLAAAPADHNLTIRWSQATIRHASGSICPLVPVADVDPASMEPQPVSTDGTYRQGDWPPSEAMLPPDFQAYDLPLPALPPAASAEGAAEAHRGQTLSITLPAFVDGEPRTYRFDLAITDVVLSQPAAAAR